MTHPTNPEVAILNAALELPAEQRAAYLDRTCAGNARPFHSRLRPVQRVH